MVLSRRAFVGTTTTTTTTTTHQEFHDSHRPPTVTAVSPAWNEHAHAVAGHEKNSPLPHDGGAFREKWQVGNNHHNNTKHYNDMDDDDDAPPIPEHSWVRVTNVPPLSLLDDVLREVYRVLRVEQEGSIIDLDDEEGLGLWQAPSTLPWHWVLQAHVQLSTLFRPTGWFLQLPHKSCVYALLTYLHEWNRQEGRKNETDDASKSQKDIWHLRRRPLTVGGRILGVSEFAGPEKGEALPQSQRWNLSSSVLRVENCPPEATVDDVRYLFRRFDLLERQDNGDRRHGLLTTHRPRLSSSPESSDAVQLLVRGKSGYQSTRLVTNLYLVRFATSADARAAVRELQNAEFMGRRLLLARFPDSFQWKQP